MSIRLRAAVLGIGLLLLVSMAAPVLAGIEPAPWKEQVNKLNAVANDLEEINRRLNDIYTRLGVEPTPWVFGAVGELHAMANQLDALARRVNAVLLTQPDPTVPELREAFGNVLAEAQGILTTAGSTAPPDPWREALGRVIDGAQSIVDLANQFLGTS